MTENFDTNTPRSVAPAWRRKLLFAALYFSEGAPIGFIWFVIPVQLRVAGVPLEKITGLSAALIIPWTFKFLWAPLVDSSRAAHWSLKHWVVAAQIAMALTLLPLVWLDPVANFSWLATTLLLHAVAAATQDVSIDALCIASTSRIERGSFNGWMQVGMLLGRATMGGGLLAIIDLIGQSGAVALLLASNVVSMALLFATRLPITTATEGGQAHFSPKTPQNEPDPDSRSLRRTLYRVLQQPQTWWGIAFALIAGAAFKSFEVIYPLYLVDRGFSKSTIGSFTAGPMIGSMVVGSVLGGWSSDRAGSARLARNALIVLAGLISLVAIYDRATAGMVGWPLFALLILIGLSIGVFTAASYALFMNLTQPGIAATQFSTFMGAVNGCESWSVYLLGLLVAHGGYDAGLITMCAISLLAIPILAHMCEGDAGR